MKKVWFTISMSWGPAVGAIIATLVMLFLLYFQIGTLTKGAHPLEVATNNHNPTYASIFNNPVDAPYYTVRNTLRKLKPDNPIVVTRGLSAFVGVVSVALYFALVSLWYRPRVALMGTLLFATSNWLLRNSRLAVPEIQQTLILALIFLPAWLKRTRYRQVALYGSLIALAYLLYVPGMIWFIAAGILWRARYLGPEIKNATKPLLFSLSLLFLIIISPLLYQLVLNPKQLLDLLGLPDTFSLTNALSSIVDVPMQIFIRGNGNSLNGVGRMPLLDAFTGFMVLVGMIDVLQTRKLDRSKIVLGVLLVSFVLICVGGSLLFSIIMPAIYLLATAGISYMLNEWLQVFPRNPLARGTATILMSIAVLIAAAYNVSNYFIAWPNTPATKSAFSQRY